LIMWLPGYGNKSGLVGSKRNLPEAVDPEADLIGDRWICCKSNLLSWGQ
jgi:hypothetical protein